VEAIMKNVEMKIEGSSISMRNTFAEIPRSGTHYGVKAEFPLLLR
jgi:hypothetical protein